jgi:hypothetical protein
VSPTTDFTVLTDQAPRICEQNQCGPLCVPVSELPLRFASTARSPAAEDPEGPRAGSYIALATLRPCERAIAQLSLGRQLLVTLSPLIPLPRFPLPARDGAAKCAG